MLRALLISALSLGAATAAIADDHRGRDDRYDRHEYRQDRDERGQWEDRGRWQGRRDAYEDQRRWDERGRWDNRHPARDWRARDRYYVVPAPRVYGYRPAPPRGWYPGWREPYRNGYRYWQNDRYWYAEPGRPALELSFVLPLR